MLTRALSSLVADVRFLADCATQTNRYPTTDIERLINEGYREYLELIGASRALRRVQHVSLAAGDDYVAVDARKRVLGVSLIDDDGVTWYELEEPTDTRALAANTAVHSLDGTALEVGEPTPTSGRPLYWWVETVSVPSVPDTTGSTGVIALHIYPPTDRARACHLVVQEETSTLVELSGKTPEGSAYFPVPRGDEYVVASAALKLAVRDADADKMQAVGLLKADLEQKIRHVAHSYTGGIATRQNTRRQRRLDRRGTWEQ